MELSYNNLNYFFTIESDQIIGSEKIKLQADSLISLTIVEELGKLTSGSLVLMDNDGYFSRVFRNGVQFKITWGYKKWNEKIPSYNSITSAGGSNQRQALTCVVATPSGSSNGPSIEYNCSFYATDILRDRKHKVFDSGTKQTIIIDLMNSLDVDIPFIDFDGMNDIIDTKQSIRQTTTDYQMLYQLAIKWKTFFIMGYTMTGKKSGVFVDSKKITGSSIQAFIKSITAYPDTKDLYFNSGTLSNVSGFTWEQHVGESGQGDNVRITYGYNGEPIVQQYQAGTQSVVTYRLNPKKIADKFKGKNAKEIMDLEKNYLSVSNFEQAKWAFDKIEETTAPQGMGFSITVNMVGDPSLVVLKQIVFHESFPAPLVVNSDIATNRFYIKKGTHTLSKQGYNTSLEIADTYLLTGSLLAPDRGEVLS